MIPTAHIIAVRGIYGATADHLRDAFQPLLAPHGIAIHLVEYPWTSALRAGSRRRTIRLAKRITDKAKEIEATTGRTASVLARSYGCLIAHRAPWHPCHLRNAYLLHPAVEADWAWLGYREVHVFHDERDRALRLGGLIPAHGFGHLGRIGHTIPATAYGGRREVQNHALPYPSQAQSTMRHDSWMLGDNLEAAARIIIEGETR